MERFVHGQWTAALVVRGLRLAFAAKPRPGQQPVSFAFIAERAREVLGEGTPEHTALVLRTGPALGLSIREMCREHVGWPRSRSELYRRSNNGAVRVAMALAGDGIAVPPGIDE